MRKAAEALLIGICFAAGLAGAGFSWEKPNADGTSAKSGKNIAALTNERVLPPDAVVRELAVIRARAAEVDPTLDGLLAAANREPALIAEAVIIEALKPLGLEKWRELFAGLGTHRSDAEWKRVQVVRRALLRLWAVESPEEAMTALAKRLPGGLDFPDEAAIVASQLLTRGYEHAAGVLGGAKGQVGVSAWEEVAAWCVDHAPDKIAEALDARRALGIGDAEPPSAIMEKWGAKDPAAAQQWAESQKPFAVRHGAMIAICEGLARKEIAAARAWVESLPDESMRSHMKDSLVRFAVYHGPPAAAAELLPMINPANADAENGVLWSSLAKRWALTDQNAALAWAAAAQNPENRADAFRSIAAVLAQSANSLSGKGSRATARARVYAQWAERDPLAAFAASEEDSSPAARFESRTIGRHLSMLPLDKVLPAAAGAPGSAAIREWISAWTARDPATLVSALFQMPDSPGRQGLIRLASADWRDATPGETRTAMRQALESEPPGDVRNIVARAYLDASARAGDADTAFAWLEKDIPAAEREAAARSVAGLLAGSDPAALAANLHRIPAAARPPRLTMLQHWEQIDPAAAKAWAAEHPDY